VEAGAGHGRPKPSPITFFDGTTLMGAAVVGRGTQEANDCYRTLLAELNQRIADKEGAVKTNASASTGTACPCGAPVRPRQVVRRPATNVLASTYCNSWIFSALDPEIPSTPWPGPTPSCSSCAPTRPRRPTSATCWSFFKVDGIIYHDAKTCPNNSNCRYGMPQRIEKQTGIPSLTINGDLNDLRLISDEQTKTNVEAFIEQLAENK
jgi:hypothetical protein